MDGPRGGLAVAPAEVVRVEEWRRVDEFCTRRSDTPAALAIVGEPGSGKSTLWRAGVRAAEEAGHRLFCSEPSAAEAAQSFTGLSDLLTELLPEMSASVPAPQLEAVEIALLLRRPGDEPPTARAIGLGVLAMLRACVSRSPVLVAVDDLQWMDQSSLDTLAFALRRLERGPLSLLVAARTPAPADPLTLGTPPPSSGWRDLVAAVHDASEIDLAPLAIEQVKRLLYPSITATQLHNVFERSRGNPFWAKEVSASIEYSASTVPPAARALNERLTRSLSADAAQALAVVAAAGRLGVTATLAALDGLGDPVAALDATVTAGVVVESAGLLSAAHPLIAEAALDSMPPGRRRQLYQRLAASSPNLERQAHFATLAVGEGPDAAVADVLDAAAASAHSRAANAMAAEFAMQAVTFTPPADETAALQRRIRAAELLFLSGDMQRSLEQLEALPRGELPTRDLERTLPLLLDITGLLRGAPSARSIVAKAVDTAGPDPRRRALVLALAADVGYGEPGGRRRAAEEAIACADAAGPEAVPALHRALINLVISKVTGGEGLDVQLIDRARSLESGLADLRLHDSADFHLALWSSCVEDLVTSRSALGVAIERARTAGDDVAVTVLLGHLAATELLAGDYEAASIALEGADEAAMWHDWPPLPWLLQPRCDLMIAGGDLEGAADLAARHLADDEESAFSTRYSGAIVRGRLSLWRGDVAAAVPHFELAAWCAEQWDSTDPGARHRLDAGLAEGYVASGRLSEAEGIADRLRELGERLQRPALVGDACRIEALTAASGRDLDRAADLANEAVAAHRSSPLRLEEARSLLTLGQIERRRKARREARAALGAALALARAIGHQPLCAAIETELPSVIAARSANDLTATERRVAELIADGATNRQAATALFVSVRTVETHVASIYRKLGVRTCSELTRKLSR